MFFDHKFDLYHTEKLQHSAAVEVNERRDHLFRNRLRDQYLTRDYLLEYEDPNFSVS